MSRIYEEEFLIPENFLSSKIKFKTIPRTY